MWSASIFGPFATLLNALRGTTFAPTKFRSLWLKPFRLEWCCVVSLRPQPLLFLTLFSLFFSWTLCAFRNRPLSQQLFLTFSHSSHLQMSLSQISRLTHNHRLSRTQVLLVLAALILTCNLPLVVLQAMAPQAPACLPISRHSYAICPDDRLSNLQPTEWYQQDDEFLRSAVLVRLSRGQNKNTIKKFCDDSFSGLEEKFEIKCKTSSDNARLIFI